MYNSIWKPNELTNMNYAEYEKVFNNTPQFTTPGSLALWSDAWGGWLDENPLDHNMPYVIKGCMFYYFAKQDNLFVLQMTSTKDLNQKEK